MYIKSFIAYAIWVFAYYGLLVGCLLCGCLSHSTVGYAMLASIGGVILTIGTSTILFIWTNHTITFRLLTATMLITIPLTGGFLGYTWDNYCALMNGHTLENAQINDPVENRDIYKFKFNSNIYVLNSMTEHYNYNAYNWFAAPAVECINGSTPDDTCGIINKTKVGFFIIEYKYSAAGASSYPKWNNDKREAARLKLFYSNYIYDVIGYVKNKYQNKLIYNNDEPYLVWDNLSNLEKEWGNRARATLIVSIFVPAMFILIMTACILLLKR